MNIPAVMFCLGVLTLTAQFVFTREILILGTGNELTIGIVIAVWLVWTGAGAAAGRRVAEGAGEAWWRRSGAWWLVVTGCLVPAVLVLLRVSAGGIRSGPGAYLPLHAVFLLSAAALMPVCFLAGFLFPCACAAWAGRSGGRGARTVYAAESLGSFAGGLLCTFGLATIANGLQGACASTVAGLAAAALVSDGAWRRLYVGMAFLGLGLALWPGLMGKADDWTLARRWARLGVAGVGQTRLVASRDTRYQHLALAAGGGQYTLYADGQVAYSFPDLPGYEHTVHRIMAQKPDAARVLVIGGNPAGEIPVLLQYPLRRLVRVELDPGVDALIREAAPSILAGVESDPRLETLHMDGARFLKSRAGEFDVILVRMPEPVTAGINRFYTREFYADAERCLAPGGFLFTSLEASERLEADSVRVAASAYKALKAVFPHVRVTAGSPLGFFAARGGRDLTFDPAELERRWRSAAPRAEFFQPGYFAVDDAMDAGRMARVERRLEGAPVPVNSLDSPVSCYQMLVLWSRYSGSRLESWMRGLEKVGAWQVGAGLVILLIAGFLLLRLTAGGGAGAAICLVMGGAGFTAVALEVALLYLLQGLCGYVYSQVGFVVGLFMLGVVAGAWMGGWMEGGRGGRVKAGILSGLAALFLLSAWMWRTGGAGLPAWAIPLLVLAVGMILGWQFIGGMRWLGLLGVSMARASSAMEVSDYLGSALGGLATGVLLLPVYGLHAVGGILMMVPLVCAGIAYLYGGDGNAGRGSER